MNEQLMDANAARRFHRTLILIEVIGEEPFEGDVGDLAPAITDGDMSGRVLMQTTEEVTAQHAAQILISQGSDPGFLLLTEDGGNNRDYPETYGDQRASEEVRFWLEPIGAPGQTWGPFDTELSASEFLDRHPTADDTTHKIVQRHDDGRWDGSWVVVDEESVVNGRVPLLGCFPTERGASEFIGGLPEHPSGRYGVDGPPED